MVEERRTERSDAVWCFASYTFFSLFIVETHGIIPRIAIVVTQINRSLHLVIATKTRVALGRCNKKRELHQILCHCRIFYCLLIKHLYFFKKSSHSLVFKYSGICGYVDTSARAKWSDNYIYLLLE